MKNFLFLFIISLALLSPMIPAHAGPDIDGGLMKNTAQKIGFDPATDTSLSETVGKIIRVALSLIGTIFLVLTVYAGFLWMTAGGNDERITKAQGILKTSVTGLIIVVSAYSITFFAMMSVFKVDESTNQVGGTAPTSGGFLSGFAQGFTGAASSWWKQ